jgi:hypothetical protein
MALLDDYVVDECDIGGDTLYSLRSIHFRKLK